jgi:lysophospholipase L1-like esterase
MMTTTIDQRLRAVPWRVTKSLTSTLTVRFYNAAGSALNVSSWTFAARYLATPGAASGTAFTVGTSGAATGVITVTADNAVVANLSSGVWSLIWTVGGEPSAGIGGSFTVEPEGARGARQTGNGDEVAVTVGDDDAINVTVLATSSTAAMVTVADTAGVYTATTVESVLAELPAKFGGLGRGVARFIRRAQNGENLTITAVGDSILEGQTVTNPATDGCVILLAADLSTRFGVTVTATNRANSGYTIARGYASTDIKTAIADAADLYLIAYGKNDIGWEIEDGAVTPVPGYPLDSSIQQMERLVRLIRLDNPHADIILMAENPYTAGSSSNPFLQTYNARVARIAAMWGCEFVDCYTPFTALGDYSAYMADSTHPNTAGHRLMADTLLRSFPVNYDGGAVGASTPADNGIYTLDIFDDANTLRGWANLAAPVTTSAALTWANTGTWSGSNPYLTTTPGDYAEFTFYGTECLVQVSTAAADALVATVTVDGVDTYTSASFTNGKKGIYYVPIAVGLAAGQHTVRLTLVSGSLKLYKVAATSTPVGGFTGAEVQVQNLDTTVSTVELATDGAISQLIADTSVALPTGWTSMAIQLVGFVQLRVLATTTSYRRITTVARIQGTAMHSADTGFPATGDTFHENVSISVAGHGYTAARNVRLECNVASTDKTNCQVTNWKLTAIKYRTA